MDSVYVKTIMYRFGLEDSLYTTSKSLGLTPTKMVDND